MDLSILNNPLVSAAATSVLLLGAALAIAQFAQKNKPAAQDVADYSEAIEAQIARYSEAAVKAAEMFGAQWARKGVDKMTYALDFLQAELKKQGIEGDASRVTEARLRADLEAALRRVINNPKKVA